MNRQQPFDSFQLYDHRIIHQKINSVSCIYLDSIVNYRKWQLRFNVKPIFTELIYETCFICAF